MPRIRAPELPQHYPWLNSDRPLSLKELRKRVVILDFWTYCCINCLHVLPTLNYLEQKYKDYLTIIGVHSPKFDHEKELESIQQAILRYGIEHPVLIDNDLDVWQQYTVKAWPTLVIIDPDGYVIGQIAGESDRNSLDSMIGNLIHEYQEQGTISAETLSFALATQHLSLTPLLFPGKVLANESSNLLCIADSGHHRIVVTTLAGNLKATIGSGVSGLVDGDFAIAQFSSPQGMAFDQETNHLYVADTGNHAIRRVDLNRCVVETIAGTGNQSDRIHPHSGSALETSLNSPWDVEKIGNTLFIAMAGSHQIWMLNLESNTIGTYIGTGAEFGVDGSVEQAAFAQPSGITTNRQDLFIADSEISTIRAVSLNDSPQARTVCGSGDLFGFGDVDGQGRKARLQHCLGVEISANALWIADTYNHKIKRVELDTAVCKTVLGDGTAGNQNGQGTATRFNEPSGLSLAGGLLYIADTNNHAIRQVALDTLTVSTLAFPGLCTPTVCIPVF